MQDNTIKISSETLSILKNFSSLNSNILIKPGNVIRTLAVNRGGMAEAVIDETFDTEFGIWDLDQFLGVVSLCNNPTFKFLEKKVEINSSTGSVFEYNYSEPRLLLVPSKQPTVPEPTATASIDYGIWSEIIRAASVLKVDDISFINAEDGVTAVVTDLSDPTAHTYTVNLEGSSMNHTFEVNFKISNIKILQGSYKMLLSEGKMAVFQNTNLNLTYWFGAESSSTYDE
jgi:hypothetical protein